MGLAVSIPIGRRTYFRDWLASTFVVFHEDRRMLKSKFYIVAETPMLKAIEARMREAGVASE